MLDTLVSKENTIRAAADGDLDVLRRFLRQHSDSGRVDSKADGGAPESETAVVRLHELIETLLREAIENGQTEAVRLLLQSPVVQQLYTSRSQQQRAFSRFMRLAIVEDYVEIVEILLKHGADPNALVSPDENTLEELTPLALAARLGSVEIAQLLVTKGADVNVSRESDGSTALHEAARQDEDQVVELLVQHGATVNAVDTSCGETPLHVAVKRGAKRAVAALLRCHADLKLANRRGSCAVHIARVEANAAILALLAGAGADLERPSTPASVRDPSSASHVRHYTRR